MEPIINITATRNKKNPPTIIVNCEVLVYSSNDIVTIKESDSPSLNPTILTVDVIVEKKEGQMKGVYKKAEGEISNKMVPQYKQVSVRYEGKEQPAVNIEG